MEHPAYNWIPATIAREIPPLCGTEEEKDPIAYVKLFTPDSSWTWYVVEYDLGTEICYGLVVGIERELGFFSIGELKNIRGPWGLRIERDLNWKPTPVSKCP